MADAWGGAWGGSWGQSWGSGITPPPEPVIPVFPVEDEADELADIVCGWTKGQFIEAAFEEIGLGSYVFDMQPDQLNMALRRLDSLMATWNANGVRLSYPQPCCPNGSEMTDKTYVPDSANEAIYTNLAIRIAPTMGKTISAETRACAKQGYNVLLARAAMPHQMQLPGSMPAGAGNRYWGINNRPFVRRPTEPLLAGEDGPIEFT